MADKQEQITGTVLHMPVAKGSKSERTAVVLRTDDGDEHILRRIGGNAFRDQTLEKLVGETITATGQVAGQTFIMDKWTIESGK